MYFQGVFNFYYTPVKLLHNQVGVANCSKFAQMTISPSQILMPADPILKEIPVCWVAQTMVIFPSWHDCSEYYYAGIQSARNYFRVKLIPPQSKKGWVFYWRVRFHQGQRHRDHRIFLPTTNECTSTCMYILCND